MSGPLVTPSMPFFGQDTATEPLIDPWWTPGWTSQSPKYQVAPLNPFTIAGFPNSAVYVNVTAFFFDDDGNPISGNLTFYPSTSLTMTTVQNGQNVTTVIPQRLVGYNYWDYNQSGSGKMYIHNGQLLVSLLATDNAVASMVPASFSYHVVEHFQGGRTYDIMVPSTSANPVDINSLIIPGSINVTSPLPLFTQAAISTQYLPVDITAFSGGTTFNPTSDEVDFAFIAGPTEPLTGDWHVGSWVSGGPPYVAQILLGPANGGLVLAAGSYIIWCRVIATPQVPIFQVGRLTIF